MQHVNVCLQALNKRLPKSCREREKREEEGARKWEETLEIRTSQSLGSV